MDDRQVQNFFWVDRCVKKTLQQTMHPKFSNPSLSAAITKPAYLVSCRVVFNFFFYSQFFFNLDSSSEGVRFDPAYAFLSAYV